MSGEDESSEKSFEPTAKRLEDARKKGDVPRSSDLNTASAYLAFGLALIAFGGAAVREFSNPLVRLMADAHRMSLEPEMWTGDGLFPELLRPMTGLLAVMFVVPIAAVVLCLISQRAITFAPSKIAIKPNRVSVIQGAKNKFGPNGVFEFAKASIKLCLVSVGAFVFTLWNIDEILGSSAQSSGQVAAAVGRIIVEFTILAAVAMGAIGAVDYFWQVAQHRKKNMMTRKEVTDENKESEGDPHFKQARRTRAQEIAINSMMSDVPGADVVVVNPTHFAVALKWDRSEVGAPKCVAKGVDSIAARIRHAATEASVPIYSDPPTARAIHATVEIGQEIGSIHYKAVAAAIRYADRARKRAAT